MKFYSTATIALVLAAGLAGGALAQTSTTAPAATNPAGASASPAQPNGQPPTAAGQTDPAPMQQGASDPSARYGSSTPTILRGSPSNSDKTLSTPASNGAGETAGGGRQTPTH